MEIPQNNLTEQLKKFGTVSATSLSTNTNKTVHKSSKFIFKKKKPPVLTDLSSQSNVPQLNPGTLGTNKNVHGSLYDTSSDYVNGSNSYQSFPVKRDIQSGNKAGHQAWTQGNNTFNGPASSKLSNATVSNPFRTDKPFKLGKQNASSAKQGQTSILQFAKSKSENEPSVPDAIKRPTQSSVGQEKIRPVASVVPMPLSPGPICLDDEDEDAFEASPGSWISPDERPSVSVHNTETITTQNSERTSVNEMHNGTEYLNDYDQIPDQYFSDECDILFEPDLQDWEDVNQGKPDVTTSTENFAARIENPTGYVLC
ncbi:uncharacterized protein LOC106157044 [Lingula anatina]|uniref:Uncharacterized protein LOC106157044 n=1 Tax=Lingula anatina TaxID=7574 RepID=A0A1S3HSF4_LINAN|nr:uncharacterized protein LOC106157044 [Lingula anatina]|eukprot:XP_013387989.1 uncharacterized protein LOC106157044 [Lingula anatina]